MLSLQFFPFGFPFGFGFLSMIIIIGVGIAVIAIWIFVLVWVYRDAYDRGMDAAIWLLIVLFTGLIGLIIYLIVRD